MYHIIPFAAARLYRVVFTVLPHERTRAAAKGSIINSPVFSFIFELKKKSKIFTEIFLVSDFFISIYNDFLNTKCVFQSSKSVSSPC